MGRVVKHCTVDGGAAGLNRCMFLTDADAIVFLIFVCARLIHVRIYDHANTVLSNFNVIFKEHII